MTKGQGFDSVRTLMDQRRRLIRLIRRSTSPRPDVASEGAPLHSGVSVGSGWPPRLPVTLCLAYARSSIRRAVGEEPRRAAELEYDARDHLAQAVHGGWVGDVDATISEFWSRYRSS